MTQEANPRRKATPTTAEPSPSAGEAGPGEIIERPDGYYWQAPDIAKEFGPFVSYELALADRDEVGDEPPERSETLRQAERSIGINDWIDLETGQPAEGQSPPHLEEE